MWLIGGGWNCSAVGDAWKGFENLWVPALNGIPRAPSLPVREPHRVVKIEDVNSTSGSLLATLGGDQYEATTCCLGR
jgi:hypothetical protein